MHGTIFYYNLFGKKCVGSLSNFHKIAEFCPILQIQNFIICFIEWPQ